MTAEGIEEAVEAVEAGVGATAEVAEGPAAIGNAT